MIAESGVAKLTFYRHFPSKNDLIRAFLDLRHQTWIDWFSAALKRYGGDAYSLLPTLAEWFRDSDYRGCAFINTVGELFGDLPEVIEITRRHKREMTQVIATLLPKTEQHLAVAQSLTVAVEGAIIRAQYDSTPEVALAAFDRIVEALLTEAVINEGKTIP